MMNQILNVDCLDGFKDVPDESVDLIIADPPYFKVIGEKWDYLWRTEEDYIEWSKLWFKEANSDFSSPINSSRCSSSVFI